MQTYISIIIFVLGAVVGSFLNVCIYRMPRDESIVRPGSHCPGCNKPINWYDNIPILSYLILRARCRFCKVKISWQYPVVELLTAAVFLMIYYYFGLTWKLPVYLVFACGLIVSSFIDIWHRIIPDEISIGGLILGLICSYILPSMHGTLVHWRSLLLSAAGAVIAGGVIFLMGLAGDFIFKKESLGGGDVKLLAAIGAFLGWERALMTFFIAPLFGAVVGIIVKLRTRESLIPYGPFLSLAALISLFWYKEIISLIFGYGFN
jgi:leader peptidase (prepilin peptidase)/N-methyltransferase